MLLTEDLLNKVPQHMIPLLTNSPRRAFAKLSQSFYEKEGKTPKISSKSVVSKTCVLGAGCRIDPGVVLGEILRNRKGLLDRKQFSYRRRRENW